LYLERLYSIREDQSDELTSFFVRRSVYFAFFGKPNRATCEKLGRLTEQNRQEQEQWQAQLAREYQQVRLDQVRLEQESLEQVRLEQVRLEQERHEQEKQKAEQVRLEQVRLEQERLEQERLEQERLEQERLARIEQKRKKKTAERGIQQPNPARSKDDKKQSTPSAIQKNRKRTTRIDFSKLAESVIQQPAESRGSASVPQLDHRTSQIQEDIGEQAIPQDL
jgi:septal ring factor EnvC (AmiA/AmiB activator)